MSKLAHSRIIFKSFGNEIANAILLLRMKLENLMINYSRQHHDITNVTPY